MRYLFVCLMLLGSVSAGAKMLQIDEIPPKDPKPPFPLTP